MYNEDRDHIVIGILDLIEEKLKEMNIHQDHIAEMWDDEFMEKIDNLFEPYSLGWRNYN